MLNKFANFRFTNVHKGIALLYGLGVYRGYKSYDLTRDDKRYYYIDNMWFAIFIGFTYVFPPVCFFMWKEDLKIIENYVRNRIEIK